MAANAETAEDRKDKRAVRFALWLGVALGLGHGIPRYGLFHMSTVAMVGMGIIATASLYAAWVALRPARPPQGVADAE
jgi:hypothetical protein